MRQSTAYQLNTGLSVAYAFNPETILFLGGYYRLRDSAIPYMAMEYKNVRLGLSYDANVSDLRETNGSFEISLIYLAKPAKLPQTKTLLFCPRF
jgi:hypothetical protein